MTSACLPIDYVEVRVRPSAVPDDWRYHRFPPGQPILIPGVEVGVQYVVETRCVPVLGGIPSAWSAATHTVQAARLYLPQVTGAAATPLADGVHLMWTRPAGLAADVLTEIYRAPDAGGMPGTFALLFTAPGTAYNDAVTNGALYWYTMRFVDYGGSSGSYSTPVYARAKTVADGADVTAQVAPPMVANSGFEAGDMQWSKNGTGWSIVNDPANARSGNWYARRDANGVASDGYLISAERRPVTPAGVYAFGGVIGSSASVTGFAFIGLLWQDGDGNQIPVYPQTNLFATPVPNWGVARGFATAPANARFVQIDCAVQGAFTAGHWRFDDLSIVEWPGSIDQVPDGPMFSRTGGTYLQAGRPRSLTSGKNMLVNPTFELATVGIGTAGGGASTMQAGVIVLDGWETSSGDGTNIGAFPQDAVEFAYDTLAFAGSRAAQLRVPAGQGVTVNANSYHALALQSDRVYPRPNEPFLLTGQRWVDSAYLTSVAGLEFIARIGICWFSSAGTLLSSGGFQFSDLTTGTGSAYAAFSMTGTVPAAAAFGRVYIALFVRNTTGATITPSNFYAVFRVDDLQFTQPVSLDAEVLDGGTFGKTRVDILTDNRPDFAKPIPNRTADYIAESAGRRWAAETGATIGAVAGVNLRRSGGVTLNDADVITSMGTANDVTNVNGTAASTVRSNAFAGWALTDPTTGVRVGGGRNLPPVRTAGAGSQWNGANLTASWDSASPANVTISAAAGTLQQGSFAASFGASSVSLGGIPRGTPQTFRLYYENSTILLGGSFSLQATSDPVTMVRSDLRIHVGTITFTVPVSGGSGSGGTPTRGGGGVIP